MPKPTLCTVYIAKTWQTT